MTKQKESHPELVQGLIIEWGKIKLFLKNNKTEEGEYE